MRPIFRVIINYSTLWVKTIGKREKIGPVVLNELVVVCENISSVSSIPHSGGRRYGSQSLLIECPRRHSEPKGCMR